MPDVATTLSVLAATSIAGLGAAAQLRTHRLRRHWRDVGLGLEERATDLASLAAVPVHFPADLQTAKTTQSHLAVLVMRRFATDPESYGRQLSKVVRAHEIGWRLDYDLFAVTLLVADRDEAVLAAERIGREADAGAALADLRAGIAMCPEDTTDFLEAIDIASRRMRSFPHLQAVARQLNAA